MKKKKIQLGEISVKSFRLSDDGIDHLKGGVSLTGCPGSATFGNHGRCICMEEFNGD